MGNITLTFNDVTWGAVCFYYRSVADRKYCKIMSDAKFIEKLRQTPQEIPPSEFENKVLLDYVNISSYDLLVGHKLAERILEKIIGVHTYVYNLRYLRLLDCDLSDSNVTDKIKRLYSSLYSISGLWLTGISKIAHVMNPTLFPLLNLDISSHFHLLDGNTGLIDWLTIMQDSAKQVTNDFHDRGFSGTPEEFISEKLGYAKDHCYKSLIKYLDEYYWLRFADILPIPPKWTPT